MYAPRALNARSFLKVGEHLVMLALSLKEFGLEPVVPSL